MQKVIVTGGAGFIGSHIVDALIEEGYNVHIVDNLSGGKKTNVNKKAVLHLVDIRDLKKLLPIFKNAKYVFHEAALPRVQYSIENPIETNEVNVVGLLNVLEASRLSLVQRVIFAASSSAYGDCKTLPLKESFPANPLSPYGAQKYIGEIYFKLWSEVYKIETVCLRYFNVYGPRLNPDGAYPLVIGLFLKNLQQNKPLTITGDGKQTRDFTHVRDVVRANLLAMKSTKVGKGEVINIGGGHRYSINHIAKIIGGKIKHIAPRVEPHDTEADIKKAKQLLNWKPTVKIEEGILELKKMFGV